MKIDNHLDKAIARMKNGEDISTAVSGCPENLRSEVAAQLQVAKLALSLKSKPAPQPLRRKLYLQAKQQNSFVAFFQSYKIYASGFAVIAILVASTAFAAYNSVPGDRLFALKQAYESAQLHLTTNPQSKASLALNFANASLHDAEQVISSQSDSVSNQQALADANSQTQVAINSLQQNSNPAVLKDPAIISGLKNLAKTQNNLVAQIPSSQDSSPAVQSAKQSVGVLQNLIATATSSQSSSLPSDTLIDASGTVSAMTSNTLQVDKNTYNFEPSGVTILDKTGSTIGLKALQVGDTVRVQGIIQNNLNVAQTITVLAQPTVQQQAPAASSSVNAGNQNAVSEPALPNDVIGTFIPEPANLP